MLSKTRLAVVAALLVMAMSVVSFAVELPPGAVKGLPSGLVVLDEDGNSPNSKGEYFVNVDNMLPETQYTKQVAVMNLREDAQYHVYFSAEPYAKYGTIDLENEVECCIYLNDNQIYKGLVNGKGDSDISKTALDLGNYKPNESARLKATFVWHPSADSEAQMKLYDTAVYGQVDFKWIFYASVGENGGGGNNSGGGGGKSSGGGGGSGKTHTITVDPDIGSVTEQPSSEKATRTDASKPSAEDVTGKTGDSEPSDMSVDEAVTNSAEHTTVEQTTDEALVSTHKGKIPPAADIVTSFIEKLPGGKVLTGAENGDFIIVVILYISVILLALLAAYVAYKQHKLNKRKNI